jgi:SWIM/SEC-C metal-binding protein
VARIGTERRPAVLRVQTAERAELVMELCQEYGVHFILGVEPDKPEDLTDMQRALEPPEPVKALPKVGRNEQCPCGSGTKFKKCCGRLSAQA